MNKTFTPLSVGRSTTYRIFPETVRVLNKPFSAAGVSKTATAVSTIQSNWHYLCKRMFDGMDRDLPGFDEDAFYPYDEDGEFRNWSIEYID